jgi:hypothetical protein
MLHRAINVGNVLISNDNSIAFQGFIIDLDVAQIASLTIQRPATISSLSIRADPRTHTNFEATTTVKHGANIMVGSVI